MEISVMGCTGHGIKEPGTQKVYPRTGLTQ